MQNQFTPMQYQNGARQYVQSGMAQQGSQGGGGSTIGSLLDLAGAVGGMFGGGASTGFLGGAEAGASIGGGSGFYNSLLGGDETGAEAPTASVEQAQTSSGGGSEAVDESVAATDSATEIKLTEEPDPSNISPALMTQQEYRDMMYQAFIRNPQMMIASLGGMMGQGNPTFQQGLSQGGFPQ